MRRQAKYGNLAITAVAALAISLFAFSSATRATDDTPKPLTAATGIRVYICKSSTSSVTDWRSTVTSAIARALGRSGGAKIRIMGEAECGAEKVEIACTAGVYDKGGPILICSPDTLLALLRTSAWYALGHAEKADEDYEAFRSRKPPRLGLTAFLDANRSPPEAVFSDAMERLRLQGETPSAAAQDLNTRLIFYAILDLVFAVLFGHEGAHLETTPPYCAVNDVSRTEEGSLWRIVQRIAASGELYKKQVPEVGEVRADRCGARHVRIVRTAMEGSKLSLQDQEFARRAAADIISTMLLVRFGPGDVQPSFIINESYLYTPLRIVVLAGEMNIGAPGPTLCGGAAENLVQATQFTYRERPGDGLIPDEIEQLFPKGVIDAWARRAEWSPQAFACR